MGPGLRVRLQVQLLTLVAGTLSGCKETQDSSVIARCDARSDIGGEFGFLSERECLRRVK